MNKLVSLAVSAALCLGALLPASAAAQDLPDDMPHREEVDAAADIGARLYAYDQAAWHGTDRFVADMEAHGSYDTSWLRGFMVMPGKNGQLDTIFYGEDDGQMRVAARYAVDGSEVLGGGLLEGDAREALTRDAVRMAQARATAFAGMAENEYRMCADANPNTVVFPPDENDEITVYVLTPMLGTEAYPLGGHYRFTVGADDGIRDSRRFLNSCFAVPMGMPQGGPEGSTPVGVFITHLLDEYPTEVHFFASRYVSISLMVGTMENDMVWNITGGVLESVDDMPPLRDD